jgi:hypothetical protein
MTTPDLRTINPFVVGTTHTQALATEIVQMTMDSFRCASETMQKMQHVRSWDDMFKLEGEFLKSSFEGFAAHSAKLMQIASAMPTEIAGRMMQTTNATAAAVRNDADDPLSQATQMSAEAMRTGADVVQDMARKARGSNG